MTAPAVSRRRLLRLLGGGTLGLAGAALLGCGDDAPAPGLPAALAVAPPVPVDATPAPPAPLPPMPAAFPPPNREALPTGRLERTLLPGSEWATPFAVTHSGVPGPRVMVLGGVHGNEPGGWLAAEDIAGWQPRAGSLIVVPRANRLSTFAFVRTVEGFGDLNRLYPGDANHRLPMARTAAAITEVAREFEVELLLDLHESWGFFRERAEDGSQDSTAFIGQTVMKGTGPFPLSTVASAIAAVNDRATSREQLTLRDRFFSRPPPPDVGRAPVFEELEDFTSRRFRSSLSLGAFVPGLTPILIEMGQREQPEARRSELHQWFARQLLTRVGVL